MPVSLLGTEDVKMKPSLFVSWVAEDNLYNQ